MPVFPELNVVLDNLVSSLQDILKTDLVGFYLIGSFAVGDADFFSDCDFMAIVRQSLTANQETSIRALHADIPTRPGHWNINLEGTHAPVDDLRTLDTVDQPWLYVDRGWQEVQWSPHFNCLEQRWILRECGVTLIGPEPMTFAAVVPGELLRAAMARQLPRLMDDLAPWIDIEKVAWGQRYAVESLCRMFWTYSDGQIHSKSASLDWAMQTFEPKWTPLLQQVRADRTRPWNPDERPPPGNAELTHEFARAVLERVNYLAQGKI